MLVYVDQTSLYLAGLYKINFLAILKETLE